VDELEGVPDYERIVDNIVDRILPAAQNAGKTDTE
jgi:hypothetical protein